MYFRTAALIICLFAAGLACGQTDPCEGYIDSPDAPHSGPRRFNVIRVAFALADSYVLIVDPEGHRFGIDSNGKRIPSEIPHAFYEDDNTTEMDTNLPRERQPQEMTVDFAKSGKYLIIITARKPAGQWLKIRTNTCDKVWEQAITIPAERTGAISRRTLVYDSHAKKEPQVLDGDLSNPGPRQSK